MKFNELAVGDTFRFRAPSDVQRESMTKVSALSYHDDKGRQWKAGPHAKCERIDVRAENHGSTVLLRPLSLDAWLWLDRNLDGVTYEGAFVVEARYSGPILLGARDAGLVLDLQRQGA